MASISKRFATSSSGDSRSPKGPRFDLIDLRLPPDRVKELDKKVLRFVAHLPPDLGLLDAAVLLSIVVERRKKSLN